MNDSDSQPLHRPASQGKWKALALTISVHVLLGALLFLGVQWQSHPVAPMSAELVASLPPPRTQIAPIPEPVTPPKPTPAPKPEPDIAPKPVVKPDIAIKTPDKPKPVVKPKPEPKVLPKPVVPPKKPDLKPKPENKTPEKASNPEPAPPKYDPLQKLEQEAERLRVNRLLSNSGAQAQENAANAAASASARKGAKDAWGSAIKARVQKNWVIPPIRSSNTKATFRITLSKTGHLQGEPKLLKSSGDARLDDSVRAAILKSDPLPLPAQMDAFESEIEITFDPLEN